MFYGIESIKELLSSEKVYLDDSTYNKIITDIENKKLKAERFHVAILIDEYCNVLSYGINDYYKSNSYPFTTHAEISCLTKYYSKRFRKGEQERKKTLIIIRLSPKRLKLGQSAPCKHCARYIENNMENINIKKIIYSKPDGIEVKKSKHFNVEDYRISSGHRAIKDNCWVANEKNIKNK